MDFNEVLKNGVVGYSEEDKLAEERAKLVNLLEEEKSNVIKDPSKIKRLEKQIEEIDKKINKLSKSQTEVEHEQDENMLDDEDKAVNEKEQKEEEEKKVDAGDESIVPPSDEEKLPDEEDKEKGLEDLQALKEAYYNALIAFYDKKKEVVRKQIEKGELVSSDADFAEELRLETELYSARDKYLELGKEDPYTQKRTELIEQDKESREPIEMELRNKAKKFRELEEEIRKIDKEERELNEKLLNPDLTEQEAEAIRKRQEELGSIRKRTETELAEIKEGLNNAIDIRTKRIGVRSGLNTEYLNTLTTEDVRNYNYQQSKIALMNNNVKQANKQEYENIRNRINEREYKIKQINRELNELTDSTDFERRLDLLEQLDRETNMLEADRQSELDLDRGIELGEDKAKREAYNKEKVEEERHEDFIIVTQDARDAVEQAKKHEESERNETTNILADEEEIQRENRADRLQAVAVSAIVSDSPIEMAGSYVATRAIQQVARSSDPFRAGLQDRVTNIEDPEDAKRYLEVAEKADKELDRVTEKVQQQI